MERANDHGLVEIQQLQFTAIDLNLYLDTHPENKEALRKYNKTIRKLNKAKKAYEAIYGPLTNFGFAKSKYPWQWVDAPWPWEV